PPWERNRIPLIFYGDKLKSAVGFFRVFDAF
ncbi:TPA: tRNA lysidine(34) synthetase TilS, partial [Haemophilus influenzae]